MLNLRYRANWKRQWLDRVLGLLGWLGWLGWLGAAMPYSTLRSAY
jgi:hypothetical protein